MTEIIGVRFRGGPKEYYFDPRGVAVAPGQYVIVETAAGQEYARWSASPPRTTGAPGS